MQSTCPALVPEPRVERMVPALKPAPAARPALPEAPPPAPKEAERSRRSSLLPWSFPLVAFAGVSLLVVVFLLQFARIVQLQYDLIAKKETLSTLLHEKAELELSIEQLSALNRIEGEARRLGMVHPENWQVLDLVHLARRGLDGKVASAQAPPLGR